jgi:hypothetical protein
VSTSVVINEDILLLKEATGDEQYLINDDLMIKIMVLGKKDIKNQMLNDWANIRKYSLHPELGKAASLISNARPLVVSPKVLIIECSVQTSVDKLNDVTIQAKLQSVIETVFNKKMFIYAVSRNESVRLQQKYINLLQLSKLPKSDTIELEFLGDK